MIVSLLFSLSLGKESGDSNDHNNQIFLSLRPNLCLLAKKLDPYTMGALLSLYEHKVLPLAL